MEALDELTLRRRRQRMLNPITGELARLEQLMFVHTPPSTPSASASSHMEEPKAEERPEAQAEEEELIPQPPVEPLACFVYSNKANGTHMPSSLTSLLTS
jgi:hypothetical protein